MAGLDDQVTYCRALVVHYKVIEVADRSVAGLSLIAAKVAVAAKSLHPVLIIAVKVLTWPMSASEVRRVFP